MKASSRITGFVFGLFAITVSLLPASELTLASLHPLLTDLARQVGGDKVVVVELIGPYDNPHEFDPSPMSLRDASDAKLILASGKGLEASYLPKLRDGLGPDQEIFEVGRRVHSLVAADGNLAHACAHHRHTGVVDPHWWHDPENMSRAAGDLADKLSDIDPTNRTTYKQNAEAYQETLGDLDRWIDGQIQLIPPQHRVLATSHLAFGYFCRRYGLTAVGVQGLNREDNPSPRNLAEIISYLKENKVPTLFPEVGMNPKALESVAREAGIPLGEAIFADGTGLPPGSGYVAMMKSNVNSIVDGLAGPSN